MQTYDYIVVGAGSAGAAVANRLSADPRNKVLLLEAFRTPAAVHPLAPVLGRHPKTLNDSGRSVDLRRDQHFVSDVSPEADIVAKPVAGQSMAKRLPDALQPLPAVNMYRLAREKTCVIRGEKCDDRSDLVRLPDPTQDVAIDHGV